MELWTTAKAAEYLGIKKPLTAKRKLLEWGVLPIPLGRGRSLGDRWRPQEVSAALDRLQGEKAPKPKREGPAGLILGRDMKELIRELTSAPPKQ